MAKRSPTTTPTTAATRQIIAFTALYDHFNRSLFDGSLPHAFLNFSRKNHTNGFFAPLRWSEATPGETARPLHEISIHPGTLSYREPIAIASTLVHEMVHLWQHDHGKPSRTGYHNSEWADRMESIGLMPSDTGAPGGKRVGQRMTHYIIPGGAFDRAFHTCASRLPLQCVDTSPAPAKPRAKCKYQCTCGASAWGKPSLHLRCDDCDLPMTEEVSP